MIEIIENILQITGFWILVPASALNIGISVVIGTYQIRQRRIDNQRLYVVLHNKAEGHYYKVCGNILRKDFTRGEIRGVISMNSAAKNGHFSIAAFNCERFFSKLNSVQSDRKKRVLCLSVRTSEVSQFDWVKMNPWQDYRDQNGLTKIAFDCQETRNLQ